MQNFRYTRSFQYVAIMALLLVRSEWSLGGVKIVANASKAGDTLVYRFAVTDSAGGAQGIEGFAVAYAAAIFNGNTPAVSLSPPGWFGGVMSDTAIFDWGSSYDSTDISPGLTLPGFKLMSFGIPYIANSYTWYRAIPDTGEGDENAPVSVFSYSVINKTIAPQSPPSPFDSLKFLDTLKSYTTQSRSLGWITNQATANKYTTLFSTVQSLISQGSGQFARITLDSIVANTIRDSSGAITSEAYALLRFNSEYLKAHLPRMIDTSSTLVGWNMVSVPVEVSDFRKTKLFPVPGPITSAYWYKSGTGYLLKDTLANGNGYWVKYGTATVLSDTGLRIDSLRIPLLAGWNMIGPLSFDTPDSLINVENTTVTSSYFGYQASVGYTATHTLKQSKGYWIKASVPGYLGLNRPLSAAQPITTQQPPPGPGAPATPTLLSPPANGSSGQPLALTLSWNASSGANSYELQVSPDPSFNTVVYDNATITTTSQYVSGFAYSTTYYWKVDASNDGGTSLWSTTWSFTTQAPPPPPPPCQCCIQSPTQLDQFTITDASGNGQTMYVHNTGKSLALGFDDLEMPPAPAAGAFDARFKSNKIIETITPNRAAVAISVVVKNAKLPLTIIWNARTNNKIQYWLTKPGAQTSSPLTSTGTTLITSLGTGVILIQAQASKPCQQ